MPEFQGHTFHGHQSSWTGVFISSATSRRDHADPKPEKKRLNDADDDETILLKPYWKRAISKSQGSEATTNPYQEKNLQAGIEGTRPEKWRVIRLVHRFCRAIKDKVGPGAKIGRRANEVVNILGEFIRRYCEMQIPQNEPAKRPSKRETWI
ncbi:hypothetical protein ARMSODRAFT_981005 [Armillaria solidipes]|uniref:Uncharacterized protein n=1 Tax=Armillaria solidipes TaxID=1076256 RepID=A0A2H3AZ98_9AGAR|nr:hypothetical protein ARMSODRAFT_981005 [Armillaria solidipes]